MVVIHSSPHSGQRDKWDTEGDLGGGGMLVCRLGIGGANGSNCLGLTT